MPPAASLPRVTVFVACYNQERFLVETLESVRAQAYPNLQLIVADDRSKDRSPELIRAWLAANWPDAIFVEHQVNRGLCRTINEVMQLADGEYFATLAADDVWLPGKLAEQVAELEAGGPDLAVVYSDAYQMNAAGRRLPRTFLATHRFQTRKIRPLPEAPEGQIFDLLLDGNFIPAPTALCRRACLTAVGGYDEKLSFEDWDMWLRLARQYRFGFSRRILANYRILGTSMTQSKKGQIALTVAEMFRKYRRLGWVERSSPPARRAIEGVRYWAYEWYRTGDPRRHQALFRLWREERSPGHGLAYLCSRLGLKWDQFRAVYTRFAGALRFVGIRTAPPPS